MNIKKKITDLLAALPEKDKKIAENLLKKDDFETLAELVESDIIKAKKERDRYEMKYTMTNKNSVKLDSAQKLEFIDLSISDMQALKVVVQSYIDEENEFYESLNTSSRLDDCEAIEDETIYL